MVFAPQYNGDAQGFMGATIPGPTRYLAGCQTTTSETVYPVGAFGPVNL